MDYITGTIVISFGQLKQCWLTCVIWLCLVAIVPSTACAQSRSGSIDLRGSISKTVTLSASPGVLSAEAELNAFENAGELRLVLSGSEFKKNLAVAILIRSNTPYNIVASVQSQTAVLTQLRVLSVEANGNLLAGDAVSGVAVVPCFDMRRDGLPANEENLSTLDASVPFTIFNGPRISLGGGLDSPRNALKVILLLSVKPKPAQESWTLDLTLRGSGTHIP